MQKRTIDRKGMFQHGGLLSSRRVKGGHIFEGVPSKGEMNNITQG